MPWQCVVFCGSCVQLRSSGYFTAISHTHTHTHTPSMNLSLKITTHVGDAHSRSLALHLPHTHTMVYACARPPCYVPLLQSIPTVFLTTVHTRCGLLPDRDENVAHAKAFARAQAMTVGQRWAKVSQHDVVRTSSCSGDSKEESKQMTSHIIRACPPK